ncbi:hypothetical protein KQ940_22225 [Marinobacterium sp. D7]|uniref:hypothetical protein n=1 Tax=Marinobacterium ramblicola TaxID=2849041 RepID=UPI001C2D73D3|nr:hypothetical protein [Marinobacterium ramblicola]MBV1790788.1 hypothetical protein [Marinobacterium ramblicola]
MDMAPDRPSDEASPSAMGEAHVADTPIQLPIIEPSLMAQVLDKENLVRALKQVRRNKGAAGVDGMMSMPV